MGEPGAILFEVAARFGVTRAALTKHAKHPRVSSQATDSPNDPKAAKAPPARRRAKRPALSAVVVEEESPATSRSSDLGSEISTRTPTTARAKVERLVDSLQKMVDLVSSSEQTTVGAQLAVLRAMVAPLRLLGTFTGEIGASESVVASSPFYRRVRAVIVDALRPHPEAARAVLAGLERLERGGVDLESAAE